MNELIIPYSLIIPTVIGFILLVIIFFNRKKLFAKNKILWLSLIIFIVVYSFIIGKAAYENIYFQWDLYHYDLNKDGIFAGQEVSKEQQDAMQALINHLGNGFSFIPGFAIAAVISVVVYALGSLQQTKRKL
jgi:hypothetical protein